MGRKNLINFGTVLTKTFVDGLYSIGYSKLKHIQNYNLFNSKIINITEISLVAKILSSNK